jgi:small-conductance mechanosensitive channel
MKLKLTAIVLFLLLIASVYGLVLTGRQSPARASGNPTASADSAPLVDQTPLLTAQALVRLPTTAPEQPSAQNALRIADEEMDLSFAQAVLDATQHPPALSAEAKEIQSRLQSAEDALAAQQARVAQLTAADSKATGAQKDTLDSQIALAMAELELRQDEVDDAREDLIRAGGDPQDRIQQMVQEHETVSHSSDSTKVSVTAPAEAHGMLQELQQWWALHQKQLLLWRAKAEATASAQTLAAKHTALDSQVGNAETTSNADGQPESATLLKSTKKQAAGRKSLSTLDKRIENEKQLATVYGQWIDAVAAEQRRLLNGALRGLVIILPVLLIGLFLDDWLVHLLHRLHGDRRQIETLRTVVALTLQVLGVLLVLLVIFGPPTQLGTVLGLVGAGLTVALKDFIIGFVGWFVLLGKNGIRAGDWVEINGVTGEVVELGIFHTVLLETGNWTDQGHPTGRRVTFTNSYAVEGHFFNFTTSGQWLWDELKIILPTGQNPYPVIDAIHKKVLEETKENVRMAEQEWHTTARGHNLKALSAEPTINVKPTVGGTEIAIRYITRAGERSQFRASINHALVDLLSAADSGSVVQTRP